VLGGWEREKSWKMMDGQIWLESEVGKGSAFHFTIKLSEAL